MPFIAIEAQRDIHQELREKSSFIGKVLSSVEDDYNQTDIEALESLIKEINEEAVTKNGVLKNLKSHLKSLNQSFQGSGNAEITPFPKKIRDLSKYFSIYFGETDNNNFSMEYHGMGTRSWASMLTIKAFIDLIEIKHKEEVEPFFPILAAEEPEAHLHPNAQKTLYQQLASSQGQIIVSTHSPYITTIADITDIRSLRKQSTAIVVNSLPSNFSEEDKKILTREIMTKRSDILFSRALILCEGITEEQIIPTMFNVYIKELATNLERDIKENQDSFENQTKLDLQVSRLKLVDGKSLYDMGISCISVGGKNYPPFVKLACSLGIPTYIVSDNDGSTKREIEAQLRRIRKDKKLNLNLDNNIFGVSYLNSGNDFEAELLNGLDLKDEIISSLVLSETNASENKRYQKVKYKEITALTNDELLLRMRSSKASYSGFLADVLQKNSNKKDKDSLIPIAVIDAFDAVKGWLAI